MDVHIGQMRSTVHAVDGESLLAPEVLDRIVRVTLARVDEARERRQLADEDTRLQPARPDGRGAAG